MEFEMIDVDVPLLDIPWLPEHLGMRFEDVERHYQAARFVIGKVQKLDRRLADQMEQLLGPTKSILWRVRFGHALDEHPDAQKALRKLARNGLSPAVVITLLRYYYDETSYHWSEVQEQCRQDARIAKKLLRKIDAVREIIAALSSSPLSPSFGHVISTLDDHMTTTARHLVDVEVPRLTEISSDRSPDHRDLMLDLIVSICERVTGRPCYDAVGALLDVAAFAKCHKEPSRACDGAAVRAKIRRLRRAHPELHELVLARLSHIRILR